MTKKEFYSKNNIIIISSIFGIATACLNKIYNDHYHVDNIVRRPIKCDTTITNNRSSPNYNLRLKINDASHANTKVINK